MEDIEIDASPFASCTLDPEERSTRAGDFGRLFASAVRGIQRPEPNRLRLELEPTLDVAAKAARLAVAETGCCSFFTFNLEASAQRLVLDVAVPTAHQEALDSLAVAAAGSLGR
jgi:hypothetical protein